MAFKFPPQSVSGGWQGGPLSWAGWQSNPPASTVTQTVTNSATPLSSAGTTQPQSQTSSLHTDSPATTTVQQAPHQHKINSGAIIGITVAAAIATILIAGGLLFWIRYRKRRASSPSQEYRRQIHNLTPFMTPATTIPIFTSRLRPEKSSEPLNHISGEESRNRPNPRFATASREIVQHEDSGWRPSASANEVIELPPTYNDSTRVQYGPD